MRIYLDSNVFRDLKKPENKELYREVEPNYPLNEKGEGTGSATNQIQRNRVAGGHGLNWIQNSTTKAI